ncbi:MAG: hypothetical protein ACK587_15295 [Cyanobacteriota bacterium]
MTLLDRSVDTEKLVLSALIVSSWAFVTIARDLVAPVLRLLLRTLANTSKATQTPPPPPPPPQPEPALIPWPDRDWSRQVLEATALRPLQIMAKRKGLDSSGTKPELIDLILEDSITRSNVYRNELITAADRNRQGFL